MGYIAGVNEPKETDMGTIEGTVWYRERLLLPPGAELSITLEDIARMDVKSELIAETRFIPKGGPPWEFTPQCKAPFPLPSFITAILRQWVCCKKRPNQLGGRDVFAGFTRPGRRQHNR
jgi:hypothetical protein